MSVLDFIADWFILSAIVFGAVFVCGLLIAILEKFYD